MVRRSALRYVAFAGLVALLASMACIYHASIAGATIYVHQYMTVLRIRNWFGGIVGVVRVGQIVVINTSEHRILHAESGNIGCGSTAFGWSCVIGTPYWDIGTAAYDSYAIVKVWERECQRYSGVRRGIFGIRFTITGVRRCMSLATS